MALRNWLGGHSNSYHTYSLEEALEGIAAADYKLIELSAVRGWSEHGPLEADAKTLGGIQRMMNKLGLMPLSLNGHSDFTTKDGLKDGLKAIDLCERMGIEIMNTAIGGHYSESEDEEAFMGHIMNSPTTPRRATFCSASRFMARSPSQPRDASFARQAGVARSVLKTR
jgi:sugar phosphate isomerase/epimerase